MDFYYVPASAPCRSVMMTAKAVNVNLNLKIVDVMAGDHLKPNFVKINPQHTVPTLVDNGFTIWESRAIMAYLVEKYGKNDSLYPKDPQKRAVVNQRLYFDMGTVYQRFGEYYYPQFFGKQPADPEKYQKMEEAIGYLDQILGCTKYTAGDDLTIADLALLSTVSNYEVTGFDLTKYPNVLKWYNCVKSTAPGAEINQKGAEEFKKLITKGK